MESYPSFFKTTWTASQARMNRANDLTDVISLLHGDNSHVIFLVQPDEEVLVVVVVDTSSVGPVSSHTGGEQQGGIGFLEQVSGVSELFFLGLGHATRLGSVRSRSVEWEVITSKISLERKERFDDNAFQFSSLFESAARGKLESSDRSSSSNSGSKDVLSDFMGHIG